ncbi:flagellar hook protein FlgE [Paracoccus sp. MC1862]|uniref:flagellar hook protein FlgE n=1 Tax=Paracoccus sp. MC1862 TaxID=2760307 RepID=UPI0016031A33|nr:flagellar hook-basal body complex protein [Paracoccus sp. MC1862]MBB1498516.1 flagellar hook-basal body complex protein [Paracoccus sp. MC1862]QQO43864.1 flagellar hook-basal body complex protein [Paracoccus sp. MC1862]
MSISSSLNAGVAGLAANATRLAGISDNIANSGTFGYKRVDTDFESMVINQARGAGLYSAGGVRATTSRLIDEKGSLVASSHPLDIATSGRGMLPVMPSVLLGSGMGDRQMMMTSTGSFRPDAEGVLRTDSGMVLMGWPANLDGSIPVHPRDSVGGLQPVVLTQNQTSADPTTRVTLGINLPANATRPGAAGVPETTAVEYYGPLGRSENMFITFTPAIPTGPAASNAWKMEIRDGNGPAASVLGSYELAFDGSHSGGGTLQSVTTLSGGAYDPATGALSLTVLGGPVTMNIGRPGDVGGLMQLDSAFAPTNITKNGSPAGHLTTVEIDEHGMLRAAYDTGFIRTIYQVPLVDVPNPNGLIALNNQTYQVSPTSGSFYLWDAGDGPTGAVEGYAREASTTDVAAELTDLIQTQRAYSSNAKVIQTVDEMLQETTNIKR